MLDSGADFGSTLVNDTNGAPSEPMLVSIAMSPTGVEKRIGPTPSVTLIAAAVATVACPQNGTSATGEKYRIMRFRSPSPGVTKAVSA